MKTLKKLDKKVRIIGFKIVAFIYLINLERGSKSQLSIFKRIWCLLHGFSSEKYQLYNLKKNDYKQYLNDYQRRKTALINGPYSLLISDKNIFNKVFSNENITAQVYGIISNGKVILDNQNISVNEFIEFLREKKSIIIKRNDGGGGKGVYRVTYSNRSLYLNDKLIDIASLESFVYKHSNHIIVEHLSQEAYSSNIYSKTVNSMRIITMRDPLTNEVFIPIAIHKFGSEKTKPVDNVWNGGLTALIDLDSGRLGKSAYHHENNNSIEWKDTHPDTNVQIEGTYIPEWQFIKKRITEIAESIEELKYEGWDVIISQEGIKIIEGNNCSDVNILQIHEPLLKDKRAVGFYKYYKII